MRDWNQPLMVARQKAVQVALRAAMWQTRRMAEMQDFVAILIGAWMSRLVALTKQEPELVPNRLESRSGGDRVGCGLRRREVSGVSSLTKGGP